MNDDEVTPRVRRGSEVGPDYREPRIKRRDEASASIRVALEPSRRAEPLVFQRLQILARLRAIFTDLQRAGLTWEQILQSLGGALGLLGQLGIELPGRDSLAQLLDAARAFAAAEGNGEEAMRQRLHAVVLGAHHLAALTPSEADDELVVVIQRFAEDDRIEKVLVFVLQQIWEEQQAPSGALALRTPVDYAAKLAFAERTGLLRGEGLSRLRQALPQLVKLFEEFAQLAKLFS